MKIEYASVQHVSLINRADSTLEKYAIYPVTRVELVEFDATSSTVFVVKDGKWVVEKPA